MRFDPRIRVVLFDYYFTLVEIRTDEEDPAVWVRVADAISASGGPGFAVPDLRRRYSHLAGARVVGSAERYPDIDGRASTLSCRI